MPEVLAGPQPPPDPHIADQEAALINEQSAADLALTQKQEQTNAPMRAAATQASEAVSKAANTPAQQIPVPENNARHLDPKVMNDTASLFMTLGALGGLMSRQPFTAALNNMSAAMEGVQKGDAQQFDQAYAEYKANFERAMKVNKASMDEHTRILNDKNLDLTAKMNMIRLQDVKDGVDKKLLDAPFMQRMKLLDGRQKAYDQALRQYETSRASWDRQQESFRQRQQLAQMEGRIVGGAGGPPIDQLTVQMLADRYRAGDTAALQNLGFGKAAQPLRAAVLAKAAEDAAAAGQSGADIAGNKQAFAGTQASIRSYQTYADRLEALGGKIDKDINVLFDTAAKGAGPTQIPAFDRWVQSGRRALGDPDLTAFEVAIQTVKNEYGRSMSGPASNAQLHVAAMDHADKLINEAQNIDQLKAAVSTMRKDIANGTKQAKESLAGMRSRAAESIKGAKKVTSDADYDALPSGTEFIAPDGSHRRKP